LSAEGLKIGSKIFSGANLISATDLYANNQSLIRDAAKIKFFKNGNATLLRNLPTGTLVYNIEFLPISGGQICRSAGTTAIIFKKSDDGVVLKLKSG
jgi:ribosomal protein L2